MLKRPSMLSAALDYPNFECVVVVNNTPDPAMWMPIEEHCKVLGDRFKFVLANNLQGSRPARCALPPSTPPRTPRSSASSTPTMW